MQYDSHQRRRLQHVRDPQLLLCWPSKYAGTTRNALSTPTIFQYYSPSLGSRSPCCLAWWQHNNLLPNQHLPELFVLFQFPFTPIIGTSLTSVSLLHLGRLRFERIGPLRRQEMIFTPTILYYLENLQSDLLKPKPCTPQSSRSCEKPVPSLANKNLGTLGPPNRSCPSPRVYE